jgi:hypothetical protein
MGESLNTTQYYAPNGTVYTCTSNSTGGPASCRSMYAPLVNASNFALYFFASGNSTQGRGITLSNSSYNGAPCLMASGGSNSSANESGISIMNGETFSGCINPRYRIPLFLNLTTLTTISGSYYNGNSTVAVPRESERVLVRLRLSNLTDSAPGLQSLPANALGNP